MKTKLLSFLILLTLASCQDNDSGCGIIACTEEAVLIAVRVIDQNATTVTLDRTETTNAQGDVLNRSEGEVLSSGFEYIIVDDSHLNDLEIGENELNFRGWKDGQLVLDQDFLIGRDCCHVSRLEGPREISINL